MRRVQWLALAVVLFAVAAYGAISDTDIKRGNNPSYANGIADAIIAGTPGSHAYYRIDAVDPEGVGSYAMLTKDTPFSGVRCEVENALVVHCTITKISLSATDRCTAGSDILKRCKEGEIKFKLKDADFVDRESGTVYPGKFSKEYTIKVRVTDVNASAKESGSYDKMDSRSFLNREKERWKKNDNMAWMGASNMGSALTNAANDMLPAYAGYDNGSGAEQYASTSLQNDSAARAQMGSAGGQLDGTLFADAKRLALKGTFQIESQPVSCEIRRGGVVTSSYYVCTTDSAYPDNIPAATKYFAMGDDTDAALSSCLEGCYEQDSCIDESADTPKTFFKDLSYISKVDAETIGKGGDGDDLIVMAVITVRDRLGNIIRQRHVPIDPPVRRRDFVWPTSSTALDASHSISSKFSLNVGVSNSGRFSAHDDDDHTYWVEPERGYYVEYESGGVHYKTNQDGNLYSVDLVAHYPRFICELDGGPKDSFETMDSCNEQCRAPRKCEHYATTSKDAMETIENECAATTVSIEGRSTMLSDAVADGKCKLYNEVSLDKDGKPSTVFVDMGEVVNVMHPDIQFESGAYALKGENAADMATSFIDMIRNGKAENRFSIARYNPRNVVSDDEPTVLLSGKEGGVEDDIDIGLLVNGAALTSLDLTAMVKRTPQMGNEKYGVLFFKTKVDRPTAQSAQGTEPIRVGAYVYDGADADVYDALGGLGSAAKQGLHVTYYDTRNIGIDSTQILETAQMDRLVNLARVPERLYGTKDVETIDLSGNPFAQTDAERKQYLAIAEGLINIPQDGMYTFAIDGSDAIDLMIDGRIVLWWYGVHSASYSSEHLATFYLDKGLHSLRLREAETDGSMDGSARLYFKDEATPLNVAPPSLFATTGTNSVASAMWNMVREERGTGQYDPSTISLSSSAANISKSEYAQEFATAFARVIDPAINTQAPAPFSDYDAGHPVYLTRIGTDENAFLNLDTNLFAFVAPISRLSSMTVEEVLDAVLEDFRSGNKKYFLWNFRDYDKAVRIEGLGAYSGMEAEGLTKYHNLYSPNDLPSFWLDSTESRNDRLYFGAIDDTFRINMAPNGSVNIVDAGDYDTGSGTTHGVSVNNVVLNCPLGTTFDSIEKLCVSDVSHSEENCTVGEFYNAQKNRCEAPIVCPDGSQLDRTTGICRDQRPEAEGKVLQTVYDLSEFTDFSLPANQSDFDELEAFGESKVAYFVGKRYSDTLDFAGVGWPGGAEDRLIVSEGAISISRLTQNDSNYTKPGYYWIKAEGEETFDVVLSGVKNDKMDTTSYDLRFGLGEGTQKRVWLDDGIHTIRARGFSRTSAPPVLHLYWRLDKPDESYSHVSTVAYSEYNRDVLASCPKTGMLMDIASGVCFRHNGRDPYGECPAGYAFSMSYSMCVRRPDPDNNDTCENDHSVYNAIIDRCMRPPKDTNSDDGQCPPNSQYCPTLEKCAAQPVCSNGGLFDQESGECKKVFRGANDSRNGYYFVYLKERNSDTAYFLTPIISGQTEQCFVNEYYCDKDGQVYASNDSCSQYCKEVTPPSAPLGVPSVTQGECVPVNPDPEENRYLMKTSRYISHDACSNQCYRVKDDIVLPGVNMNIKRLGPDANTVGGGVAVTRSGSVSYNITPSVDISKESVPLPGMKAGDVVTITYNSTMVHDQDLGIDMYYYGMGRWSEDEVSNVYSQSSQEITIDGATCKNVDAFYSGNGLSLQIDANMDGTYEDAVPIGGNFICRSPTPHTITQTIAFDGKKVTYGYVSMMGETQTRTYQLSEVDTGECAKTGDAASDVVPYFGEYVDRKFLLDKAEAVASPHSIDTGVNGAADVYFPAAEQPVKLGIVEVDLSTYMDQKKVPDADTVYKALKNTTDLPIPFWNGVYSSDYFYAVFRETGLKKSVLRDSDLYLGYGFSQNDECRDFAVVPPFVSTSNATDFQAIGLDGTCPAEYKKENGICVRTKVITTTVDKLKMCRPWWRLVRTYQCDGVDRARNSIADDFSFGYPRWVDVCEQQEEITKAMGLEE